MSYFEHIARCEAVCAKPLAYRVFLILRDTIEGAAK